MYERIDGQVRSTLRQAAIDRFFKPGLNKTDKNMYTLKLYTMHVHV